MDELSQPKLSRPLDKAAMSNDMGILKNLVAMLNNPLITGAEAPKTEPKAGSPPPEPIMKPQPQSTTLPKINSRRLFLTGAPKVGKKWLAAQIAGRVFELDDPIQSMATQVFGSSDPGLTQELFVWGEGLITKAYPLTASRLTGVMLIRTLKLGSFGISPERFGTAGFWLESLVARVKATITDKELAVITNVWTPDQYKFLRAAGYTPIHVMCNNITRTGRGGTQVVSSLVNSIERDITQKVSSDPKGRKLWAVWCDEKYPPTSSRLLTVEEFLRAL